MPQAHWRLPGFQDPAREMPTPPSDYTPPWRRCALGPPQLAASFMTGLSIVTGRARPDGALKLGRRNVPRPARRRTGDASRPLRISPSISRLRERNSFPFTKNGMDGATDAASNCGMGQSNSAGRCEHCGGFMMLVLPVDGKGPGAFRCLECDQIDPLKLPSIAAWLVGELRPPK
jgi:hypothetical protein